MIQEKIDKKIINKFKKKGWIKIDKFVSKNHLSQIHHLINAFLNKNIRSYNPRHINFVGKKKILRNINSFHKLNDCLEVKKLSKKKIIKSHVNALLNTKKIKLRQSEYFAKPKGSGLPVPNHQDNFYWNVVGGNALTVWIALSKSNIKNGAIHYYEGTHKYGILKHIPSYAKGSSQKIKNVNFLKKFKKVTPKLDIGDALIHHSLIAHGSKANTSNTSRKGITFQFIEKESKLDFKKIKEYEKQLYKQIKQRK